MEIRPMKRIVLALLAALVAVACGAQTEKPVRAVWRAAIENQLEYEVTKSFAAADGTTWMLINVRPKGNFSGPQRQIEIRGVDKSGQEAARIDVTFALGARKGAVLTQFYDIAADKNGAIVLFASNG